MNKKSVIWKVLAEVLVLVVVLAFFVLISDERDFVQGIISIMDLPSLIGLLIVIVPGMLISGHGKDFLAAFSVGIKKYSLMQLKNILEAVTTFQKYVCYAAIIEITAEVIIVCNFMQSDIMILFPNLAVIAITAIYASALEMLIIPVRSNVVRVLNKELDFDGE